ncbi:MAG: hypothetical protein IIA01_07570 [Proteobacteria bacterium]|nr:hypothetical protein [Pseudomonadota bacterium]
MAGPRFWPSGIWDNGSAAGRFVRNCEFRSPSGYEQEIARNLTPGVQCDLESMLDHDA